MKKIISFILMVSGAVSFFYGVSEILISLSMTASSGLGAFAKQGAGIIYLSLGVLILSIRYILKKKSII